MKKTFRKTIVSLLMVVLCTALFSGMYPSGISQISTQSTAYAESVIMRAPIIDWRYKVENNKLYRRLYNYSTQQWVGEWELV